jgi:hypothetical protein
MDFVVAQVIVYHCFKVNKSQLAQKQSIFLSQLIIHVLMSMQILSNKENTTYLQLKCLFWYTHLVESHIKL